MAFTSSGDCKLYFEERGKGDPILLVPGLGLTGDAWAPVAERLSDNYRVLTMDPRGAGRSDKPDITYTATTVAEDVRAVLRAADVSSAHIVGLSMGGMIAQDFAVRFTANVRTLILVSTYAATDNWSQRVFEVRRMIIEKIGLAEQFRLSVLTVTSPATFRNHPEVVAAFESALIDNLPDRQAYLRQLDYCTEHDTREELHRIKAPTLVVTGSDDLLTSPFQGRELATGIAGAEYKELPGRSHVLVFEDADGFVAAVRSFIDANGARDG